MTLPTAPPTTAPSASAVARFSARAIQRSSTPAMTSATAPSANCVQAASPDSSPKVTPRFQTIVRSKPKGPISTSGICPTIGRCSTNSM